MELAFACGRRVVIDMPKGMADKTKSDGQGQ